MKTTRIVWAGALAFSLSGCSQKETPPQQQGELILALQTDMELPKDVDKVRIRVASFGNTLFSNDYQVGPSGLKIPATLALLANPDHPSSPVTIQVVGFRLGKARVMRETITTVPQQRIATLRVPIEWLCDDSARLDNGEVVSTCPTGESCASGVCVPSATDSSKLPDYTAADIFGGGDGSGNGSCFDVGQCFVNHTILTVDPATCRAKLPGVASKLNVALKLPGTGDGICSGGLCLIPLDGGEGGQWSQVDGTAGDVQLPPAACDRLKTGKVESVLASEQCTTKTARMPTCGPWSSAGGGPTDTRDGGAVGQPDAATADARVDAPADARVDAPADASVDAATDASVDAAADASVDTSCPQGNCMPPACNPPPVTDGGFCMGVVSMPAPMSTCRWSVPGSIATDGGGFCANLLNVQLVNLPDMPGPPLLLPQFAEGACGSNPGWQFLMGTSVLELCPAACSISMSPGAGVEFVYGCPTFGGGPGGPDGGGPPPDAGPPPGMVPIAGGTFTVGCAPSDPSCNSDEMPYHQVAISAFSIDQTEVTQGAYDACVRSGTCVAPPCSWQPAIDADKPVSCVSWDEASKYCGWISKRLPSESEWEAAARGTSSIAFPWGDIAPDCTRANFSVCEVNHADPVGSFAGGASPYGAFDMAGNVSEWVNDWYGPYDPSPPMNPMGPPNGIQRVIRGGDFRSSPNDIRASRRQAADPGMRVDSIGFRCVRPG